MAGGHRNLGSLAASAFLPGLLALLAASAVGGFVGWLVGASNTPVVATALPLVFGLVGVLWQRYSDLKERVRGALATAEASPRQGLDQLLAARAVERGAMVSPLVSAAVVAFVACAFLGVRAGIEARVPTTPPLAELLGGTSVDYREAAALTKLRLDLARMNLTPEEIREVFASAVLPMLRDRDFVAGGRYAEIRADALREVALALVPQGQSARRASRGPASEPVPVADSSVAR